MGGKAVKVIEELKLFKGRLSRKMPVERLILFGSTARNEAGRHSDIDMIVVSPAFEKVTPLKRAYLASKQWNLSYPKDFLCYTPKEFKRMKRISIVVREAVREGVEI